MHSFFRAAFKDPGADKAGSDGALVYRQPDGSYVQYIKASTAAPPGGLVPYDIGGGGQRMIVMSKSQNGSSWSFPYSYIMQPDWLDFNGDQVVGLYGSDGPTAGYCGVDGLPVYIGLVGMMHTLRQTIDNQFAVSNDGVSWWRPDRRPNVPLQPLGEYGGGLIWPFRTLTQDRDNASLLHMYFSGTEGIHADIYSTKPMEDFASANLGKGTETWTYSDLRVKTRNGGSPQQYFSPIRSSIWFNGAMMRSSWASSRLWALVPASGGPAPATVVTRYFNLTGSNATLSASTASLVVNAAAYRKGQLRAELLDADSGAVLQGYALDDCIPFRGDSTASIVQWGGASTQGRGRGRGGPLPPAVKVRFELLKTRLYGFWFEP